jgi:hypothetical protein
MKSALVFIAAIMMAGVFAVAAVQTTTVGKVAGLGSNSDNSSVNCPDRPTKDTEAGVVDQEANEGLELSNKVCDVNQSGTTIMSSAGGGGWAAVNMSGTIYKDTFGVFLGLKDNLTIGGFVFQARDQGAVIHSVNLTNAKCFSSAANSSTFDVRGWATYNKAEGFWFRLVLMDLGKGSLGILDLTLYKDLNKNWMMDEQIPLLHWIFNGLGGGNIWVHA